LFIPPNPALRDLRKETNFKVPPEVPIAIGIGVKYRHRVGFLKRQKNKRRKGGCKNQVRALLMR
jgi:hypothetical protein